MKSKPSEKKKKALEFVKDELDKRDREKEEQPDELEGKLVASSPEGYEMRYGLPKKRKMD